MLMPGVVTTTSMWSCLAVTSRNNLATLPVCRTLTFNDVASAPIWVAVCSAATWFRSAQTTVAPLAASPLAAAWPIPDPAPMTTDTRPSNLKRLSYRILQIVHENHVSASPHVSRDRSLACGGDQHFESPLVGKHGHLIE